MYVDMYYFETSWTILLINGQIIIWIFIKWPNP
jgi:hypothetical protein